jgi:preprotein translocase subunit SecG
MQIIILSIHLLVSVCLIGLVLLQRSEGGALGIGGGGGGALMSGRGASDALARLTSIAGALFLGVSLLLTWLSGAGDGAGRSVFDSLPAITSPAAPVETAPAPVEDPDATPDPTQSSAPTSTELAEAILPGPSAAEAAPASARAAPIESRPATTQPAAAQQRAAPPPAPRPQTQTASPTTAARNTPPQQGAVSGVSLTEPSTPESVDLGNGVEAVRRERAGPDQ